ncbi:MAG: ABC transporter ATP-binding protein [Candidatus Heimdallarchaeota archaeon]|nr:MAG: ABC transporter ATP-binding protein [Candidatus Gerdarchaeota archaeon]RLI72502.1 MAG: ABC transporter ATP-binding protein [Candidatus Gerdarchaeota archaeon]RLI74507.1 MAG: ABC transporter ATP-binding protein [Candidatus Heimdallarchaeota archaeon]
MNNAETFVECKDLIKIYADEKNRVRVPALRGLEMTIYKGEISLVVGPSGSGKSTLLNILAGNLKPSAGMVMVGDTDIAKFTRAEMVDYRRRRVGVVWQLPQMNLVWELTASQNIQVPMRILGLPREVRIARTKELLTEVELLDRAHHKPTQLSGGEIQRISLAVALANQPELVVLDEPTGELDSQTSEKIVNYFEKINKDLGVTMILATHDRRLIARGFRTMLLVDGRITSVRRGFVSDDKIPVYVDAFGALQIPVSLRKLFQSREDILLSRESEEIFRLYVPKKKID